MRILMALTDAAWAWIAVCLSGAAWALITACLGVIQ